MKLIQKLITLPAAVLIFVFLTVSAFAAGTAPEIQLSETGAANQYKITIKNWDNSAYSVQFDLSVNSADAEFQMDWADSSSSSYKKVEQETSGGKTNLEFYLDRRSPISNSDSAVIGNITFSSPSQKPSFSGTASVKLVDESYGEKTFDAVPVQTVAWTPSDGGSSGGSGDQDSGNSSNQNGSSSSSGSSSKRESSSSKDSKSAKATGGPASYQVKKSASPAVSWDAIAKNIQVQDGKSVLTIDMTEDGRISADILKQLKEKKVLTTLNYGKYQWVIDGSSIGTIPDNQEYYDLTVSILSMTNLSMATDRTDLVQFEVAYNGTLPFTATLYYPIGKEYAGKTVTLSYYDEQKGTLDFRASATAEEDGTVAFSFDHFSKYVITSEDLWHEEEPETAKTTENGAAASVLVPPAGDVASAEAGKAEDGEEGEEKEKSEPQDPSQAEDQEDQVSQSEPDQEEEQAPVSQGSVQNPGTISPTLLIVLISAAAIVILVVLSVMKKKSSSQGTKRR